MQKQNHGHIIVMSPPIDMALLPGFISDYRILITLGKVAYCISKFGMTLLAHGIGLELKGKGVACNALWFLHFMRKIDLKARNYGRELCYYQPQLRRAFYVEKGKY